MAELLREALSIGTAISSRSDDKGMASVALKWNPYECHWECWCDWSDNSRIETNHEEPEEAIRSLIWKLQEQL